MRLQEHFIRMLLPSRVPRCTGRCTTAPAVHMISGSGKIIYADVIRRLTVEERSVVYIEFINQSTVYRSGRQIQPGR